MKKSKHTPGQIIGKLRDAEEDKLLERELFTSLHEAKVLIEQYRLSYNRERPHSALDYQIAAEFAATCVEVNVASAPAALRPSTTPRQGTGKKTSERKPHSHSDWYYKRGLVTSGSSSVTASYPQLIGFPSASSSCTSPSTCRTPGSICERSPTMTQTSRSGWIVVVAADDRSASSSARTMPA